MALRNLLAWLLLAVALPAWPLHAQMHEGKELVNATLLADGDAVVPGKDIRLGLKMVHAEHWHTYWKYTGDSGIPTTIKWDLPPGFEAGGIEWPIPKTYKYEGDLEVYAHEGTLLLPVRIKVPAEVKGESVTIKAKASWLVCAELCIPGKAELEITLPVRNQSQPANADIFSRHDSESPRPEPIPRTLAWQRTATSYILQVEEVPAGVTPEFYPVADPSITLGHVAIRQDAAVKGRWILEVPVKNGDWSKLPLAGVYAETTDDARSGWDVEEPMPDGGTTAAASANPTPAVLSAPAGGETGGNPLGLWQALFYGLVGGLILNLMPCVLPVISLKIFGFVQQAGESRAVIFRSGLAFMAGIFVWFLGLGALVVGLKSAGKTVTWAFQFQNPWFNLVMSAIVFVFALNLLGVFEIALPGRASTALSDASGKKGYFGSFMQGVFATVLATPCTAPFLGAALGFAFVQSGWVIFAMFGSIALGMALPYVILSAKPAWVKLIPKPGDWMLRLKEFMGFLLFATLIWLLSILGAQVGVQGLVWTFALLLGLGLAAWIYGKWGHSARGAVMSLVIVAGSLLFFSTRDFAKAAPVSTGSDRVERGGISWVPFSPDALAKARSSGKIVFVDFTADWCLSCKFNERTAIDVPEVREFIKANDVIPILADWTRPDAEIEKILRQHGRVGIPFYLVYPPGDSAEPIALPELLTRNILLDAFQRAAGKSPSASGS